MLAVLVFPDCILFPVEVALWTAKGGNKHPFVNTSRPSAKQWRANDREHGQRAQGEDFAPGRGGTGCATALLCFLLLAVGPVLPDRDSLRTSASEQCRSQLFGAICHTCHCKQGRLNKVFPK